MERYVLTGAPGAGKTSVLRALRALGFAVVQEAATDVIASAQRRGVDEPWREAGFLDEIAGLQRRRLQEPAMVAGRTAAGRPAAAGRSVAASGPEVQVHDRSAMHTSTPLVLGRLPPPELTAPGYAPVRKPQSSHANEDRYGHADESPHGGVVPRSASQAHSVSSNRITSMLSGRTSKARAEGRVTVSRLVAAEPDQPVTGRLVLVEVHGDDGARSGKNLADHGCPPIALRWISPGLEDLPTLYRLNMLARS
jgi:predicted ATPase